jgi:hypothetical protein
VTVLAALARFFFTSNYFRVKEVVTAREKGVTLSYLVGRNIFLIDLKEQARILTELYPMYKQVRMVRVLPHRIFVDFLPRVPIASIRLYKFYSVDEDGVLFDVPRASAGAEGPLIVGLETKIFGPKAGKRYTVKELKAALDIIREVQANRLLRYWKVKKIDVTNPANISLYMDVPARLPQTIGPAALRAVDPLEVKIGPDDIRAKITILAGLLIQLKNDWLTIKYMDLRFREPVVKFKDAGARNNERR